MRVSIVFVLAAVFYVGGGVVSALGQQATFSLFGYHGIVTIDIGCILVAFFPQKEPVSLRGILGKLDLSVMFVAALDVATVACGCVGIIYAGSGLSVVIQASNVVWTAIMSSVFLSKRMVIGQWFAIIVVFSGLVISSSDNSSSDHGSSVSSTSSASSASSTVLFGCFMNLCSAVLGAAESITIEKLLSSSSEDVRHDKKRQSLSSVDLAVLTGLCGTGYLTIWITFYAAPRWDVMVVSQLNVPGTQVILMYMLMSVACAFLCHGYFLLLQVSTGVVVGLLLAARAVAVFVLSAVFYCDVNPVNCFTLRKGTATTIIVLGLGTFAYFGSHSGTSGSGDNKYANLEMDVTTVDVN